MAADVDMSMDEARRVKENYLALLNQLEYDQKSGLVVMVSEVAALVGAEYAKVRTRLSSAAAYSRSMRSKIACNSRISSKLRTRSRMFAKS